METKIISAFACLGKTHFAKENPTIAIDLESSDFMFDKTGYEHLSKEEFKGIKDRKLKEDGGKDYLKAIDETVKSGKYKYVFVSQDPQTIDGLTNLGHIVHIIKPLPNEQSEKEFVKRSKVRGNNEEWINGTLPYLKPLPLYYSNEVLSKIRVHLIPSHLYLSDFLEEFF